jgi:hypothetical protein
VSARVPTSGGEKEQLSCVDSQEAAAAVVHESAVALIELLARQITGSPALSHSTDDWMPHGRFSGAVFNVWLHSSCCGDLATATVVGCTSSAEQCSPNYALCLSGATERPADHRSLEFFGVPTAVVWFGIRKAACVGRSSAAKFELLFYVLYMLWRGHIRPRLLVGLQG